MADIITRLLLKTNDFDANLNKSKQSVNSFQGGVSDMAKTAGAGVAKLAGAIGLACTAVETFDKLIHSTQATQDIFEWNLAACKDGVDMFFHSLSSGDFTAFNQGIESTYNNLIKLQQLRDDFADAKVSNNVFRAQYQYRSQELKAVISDNSSSKVEKEKAATELKKITEAYSKQLTSTNDINVSQMIQNAQTKTGRYYSKEDIIRFFKVYNNPASLDERKGSFDDYASKMNELKRKEVHYEARNVGAGTTKAVIMQKIVNPEVTKQIAQLQKENNELERMYVLSQHNDKTWEELSSSVIEYFGAQGEAAQNLNFLVKQQNKVDKFPVNKEKAKEGSVLEIDGQMSVLRKQYNAAVTNEARAAVQATINELEARKINMKLVIDQEAFEIAHGELKNNPLALPVKPVYDKVPTHGGDGKKYKLPKHETPIKKQDIKLNEEYGESLSAISDIMGNMSGLFDENTASVLQWGASFLSTIGQAIPKIVEMMGVKAADTVATQQNTTATALNAGTKVIDAHAGIPFVGVALGLAGLAAIIGAMASMPKFATGGIVGGLSFSGDKVPALLNSGEMILNNGQQSNLFKLLNSKLYPSASGQSQFSNLGRLITPDLSSRKIEVFGNFSVRGRDLKLALDNNEKKKG